MHDIDVMDDEEVVGLTAVYALATATECKLDGHPIKHKTLYTSG